MKALSLLALVLSFQAYGEIVNRKCYDSTNFKNEQSIYLTFDTDNELILYMALENGKNYEVLGECISVDYQAKGELVEYGEGEFQANCRKQEDSIQTINYVNDYDEWKLYLSGSSKIEKTIEWMCE